VFHGFHESNTSIQIIWLELQILIEIGGCVTPATLLFQSGSALFEGLPKSIRAILIPEVAGHAEYGGHRERSK
jgi:hypothetical protein